MKTSNITKQIFALVIGLLYLNTATASDIVVSVKSMENLEALPGMNISVVDADNNTMARAIENKTDTTYVLSGIEKFPCRIDINTGTSLFAEDLTEHRDTVKVLLPVKYAYKELKPVDVTAIGAYIKDDRVVYMPSRREKNGAIGGAGLVRNMMLAKITVDPISDAIVTATGEKASVFIDYLPASEAEVRTLRPQDVKKIEVYDYPVDPRFMGALHVVNFVMVRYTFGGYTKIDATERFIGNAGNYTLSSKLTSNRLVFDLTAGAHFFATTHSGSDSRTTYLFDDEEIVRTEKILDNKFHNNGEFVAARLNYSGDKYLISNKIGLNAWNVPVQKSRIGSEFSPQVYIGDIAAKSAHRSGITPYWVGNYQWNLPAGFFLSFAPEAAYTHNSSYSTFNSDNSNICNDISENAWQVKGQMVLQKKIKKQALTLSIYGDYSSNKLEYAGTSPSSVKESLGSFSAHLGANLRFSKFWLQGSGGIVVEKRKIDALSQANVTPKFFVAAGYQFNDKNQVSVSSELSTWTIPLSQMAPNMMIINDIDAVTGNPNLKLFRYNAASVEYSTFPLNWLSAELFGNYSRHNTPPTDCYMASTAPGHPFLMIRSIVNSGNFYQWRYGGALSFKFINNSLNFRLSANGLYSSRSGLISFKRHDWQLSAMATYFIKEFSIQAGYTKSTVNPSAGGWAKIPQTYFFSVNWGHGNLAIGAQVTNIFNSKYTKFKFYSEQQTYRTCSTSYSDDYHRWFSLAVSYSISYAKKVKVTPALDTNYSIESGILSK